MKALFVVSPEQAKKTRLKLDKTFSMGEKVYIIIEDSAQTPGYPIKDAEKEFNTPFSIA